MAGAELLKIRIYASGTFQNTSLKPDTAPFEGAFDCGAEFNMSNIEQWFVCHETSP